HEAGRGAAHHLAADHPRGHGAATERDPGADGGDGGAGRGPRRRRRALRVAALRYPLGSLQRGRRPGAVPRLDAGTAAPAAPPGARLMAHSHADHRHELPPDLTRNQLLVLETLHRAEGPLSAYDILDRLRDAGLRAPLQVYRALE